MREETTALVDGDWARRHLDDPGVRFVEVDARRSRRLFELGHVPGAVYWDWAEELCDPIRRDVVGREALTALLSASGIANDTHIVFYGDDSNWWAAWAYWVLKLYAWPRASLLDGGRARWQETGPLETGDAAIHQATTVELPELSRELRAFRNDILPRLHDPDLALVDVRSPAEYAGTLIAPPGMSETAQRGGHIPGAMLVPWDEVVRPDGTFKDPSELRALYERVGVTPDRDVVTYCRIGERSSHTWFVLHELLAYPRVRNYDGSWTEWGSSVGMPIERAPVE